jgi:hypothetical protein
MPSARSFARRLVVLWYLFPTRGGEIYLVLSERNGIRLPENVLDRIGVPGTVVKGEVLEAGGVRALAVEGLGP